MCELGNKEVEFKFDPLFFKSTLLLLLRSITNKNEKASTLSTLHYSPNGSLQMGGGIRTST